MGEDGVERPALPRRPAELEARLASVVRELDEAIRDLELREAVHRLQVLETYLPEVDSRAGRLSELDADGAGARLARELAGQLRDELALERTRLAALAPGAQAPDAGEREAAPPRAPREAEPATPRPSRLGPPVAAGPEAEGLRPSEPLLQGALSVSVLAPDDGAPRATAGEQAALGAPSDAAAPMAVAIAKAAGAAAEAPSGSLLEVADPVADAREEGAAAAADEAADEDEAADADEDEAAAEPQRTPEELVELLLPRARWLFEAAPDMDPRELEARVAVLAAEARLAQAKSSRLYGLLNPFFGILTRIAREQLNPRGIFVQALALKYDCNWATNLATWSAKLAEVQRDLAEQRAAAHVREEAVREQEHLDAKNAEVADKILDQIRGYVAAGCPDGNDPLRHHVLEFLRFSDPTPALVRAVERHAEAFAHGRELRSLRRHLARNGPIPVAPSAPSSARASSASEPVPAPPATSLREPESHPAVVLDRRSGTEVVDHFRGAFVGRRAVLVGGSRRGYSLPRIQGTFGYAEVDWVTNERSERADAVAVADRIRRGHYGHVFFLARFASHGLQDVVKRACKESGVPFILVERGYGPSSLAAAMLRAGVRPPA